MNAKNQTLVSEIVLLGFQDLHNFKIPLFSVFLLIYIMTLWENILIIALVASSRNLKSPMYFFLQQLSLSDLLESSNIVAILLQTVIHDGATLSFGCCLTQFYFFSVTETFDCLLLTIMSYDRYVAICKPLHHTSIMTHKVCTKLMFLSWVLAFVIELIPMNLIRTLQFCDKNTINHFFCDFFPLAELSCSDTFLFQIVAFLLSVPIIFMPLILITGSYICIAHAIRKIVSNIGRQKAFSTCSSHLAVVSIFYGTLTAIYVVPPTKESQTIGKIVSLFYTVLIPLVNPVIYGLRSNHIKDAFKMWRLHARLLWGG
ncbi:hypothetical protein XELAEV_18019424mg [Xenopus laevis]|uniref:Olfactory receptor n=1 Tax=Xenopus laevis TaxID=8355 RepID=A0A974DHS1_XENLA|nr:hypothetical protein XELAEV_18019424mg [Xenopus laevis]